MSVKTLTLSEIAEINPSLGVSLDETDEVSFVPMGAFSEVTASVVAEETRQFGQVKKGFTGFRSGDVIFAKITPCFENGKIGLANISRDVGFGSTEFHVIRARPEMADPRFLHHFLRLGSVRLSGTKRMTGSAGQRRVPKSFLESLPVPALPLDEQRRIAAMLDKAEELRAKRRAAIALLDQLPQAIFLEMFGDGVPLKSLSELAELKRGPFGGALRKEFFVESGFKVYEQGNVIADDFEIGNYFIDERRFSKMRGFEIAPDDLLVSCSGTLGRIAQVPRNAAPGLINQALLRLRVRNDQMRPTFLRLALQSHAVQQVLAGFSRGSGLQNFPPMSEVRSLLIPAPDLHAQDKFIVRVEQIAGIRAAYQSVLGESHALFTSLQWSAFSGDCG